MDRATAVRRAHEIFGQYMQDHPSTNAHDFSVKTVDAVTAAVNHVLDNMHELEEPERIVHDAMVAIGGHQCCDRCWFFAGDEGGEK